MTIPGRRLVLASTRLPFEQPHWSRLAAAVAPDELVIADPHDRPVFDAALARCEIALIENDIDERFVTAPALRWVHCDHAGLTRSARPETFARGLIVTGSAGRSREALAEHVMTFCLLLCSRFSRFYAAQQREEWLREPWMRDLRALSGRTMAILGAGHTGCALARRAKAFDMRVLGYRRRDLPPPEGYDRVYSTDRGETLDALLPEADILAIVLNLSDATRHLIDGRAIGLMKQGAILVNLARGAIVDQDAMIAALEEGRLSGAGLDVTDPEPLPPGHPLWRTPNVLITPHFTAALPDKVDRSLATFLENLSRYRAGQPMLNRLTEEDVWTG